jgi:hypothetical protein
MGFHWMMYVVLPVPAAVPTLFLFVQQWNPILPDYITQYITRDRMGADTM